MAIQLNYSCLPKSFFALKVEQFVGNFLLKFLMLALERNTFMNF